MPVNSPTPTLNRSEAGSAYVITLMVLFVLTVLGLSLALITQGEVDMAGQERTVERTFYSADAGVAVSSAKLLQESKLRGFEINMADALDHQTLSGFDRADVIAMSDSVEVQDAFPSNRVPCNYCPINQDQGHYEITHMLRSEATRQGRLLQNPSATPVPVARATVTAMVDHSAAQAQRRVHPSDGRGHGRQRQGQRRQHGLTLSLARLGSFPRLLGSAGTGPRRGARGQLRRPDQPRSVATQHDC